MSSEKYFIDKIDDLEKLNKKLEMLLEKQSLGENLQDEIKLLIKEIEQKENKIESQLKKEYKAEPISLKMMQKINSKERNRKPLLKINSCNIKMGSAVYLKSQDDVDYEYDEELKYLINTGHRFAVGIYLSSKSDVTSVHLLSTSSYVNEHKQCGRELRGDYSKYGNGKKVYIDLQKAWVIKKSCIKSFQYDLIFTDAKLIEVALFSTFDKKTKFIKGMYGSGVLDRCFEDYEILNKMYYDPRYEIDLMRNSVYNSICNSLTYNKIENILLTEDSSTMGDMYNILKDIKNKVNCSCNTMQEKDKMVQELYKDVFKNLDDDSFMQFINNLKRGYAIDG